LFLVLTVYVIFERKGWRNFSAVTWFEVCEIYQHECDWEIWAILAGASLFLCISHYYLLRVLPSEGKKRIARVELAVICVLLATAVFGVWGSYHHIQLKKSWHDALWQSELEGELFSMVERGEYKAAVTKMEKAMVEFRHAKEMLGDDVQAYRGGGSGISYIYTTTYITWDETSQQMPNGINTFIQMPMDGTGSEKGHREPKWQALAKEMSLSEDLVLRCWGYWLLDDRESFRMLAYAEAEKGNESCYGFAFQAAVSVDRDPVRAFHAVSPFWRKIRTQHAPISVYIFRIGALAEEAGASLGKYETEFRQALLEYHSEVMANSYPGVDDIFSDALARHGFIKERNSYETHLIESRRRK